MNKILKFSSTWCSPCKQMELQLEKLQNILQKDILIEKVDVDVDSNLSKQYSVRSIPTLIKLDAFGVEVDRMTGSVTDAKLLAFVS